jgi:predicted adenylyl cyclase CyaB
MIEAEVRFKVSSKEKARLLSRDGLAWSHVDHVVDYIFKPCCCLEPVIGPRFVRIRQTCTGCFLQYKGLVQGDVEKWEELSLSIDAPAVAALLLKRIGMEPSIVIGRKRRTAEAHDTILCLDEVDLLGDFIEIEAIAAGSEFSISRAIECLELQNKVMEPPYGRAIENIYKNDETVRHLFMQRFSEIFSNSASCF